MKPQVNVAMFPLEVFYGFDHPKYFEVFLGLGDDRDRFTNLIGNAIIQRIQDDPVEFREMISMQLGYMGMDSDETEFYDAVVDLLRYICNRCSPRILSNSPTFIDATEDSDWVNVFYHESMEPIECTLRQNDSISLPGSPTTPAYESYMTKYIKRNPTMKLVQGVFLT